MKNIVLTSMLSITLLTSCSWIMGKDKNELQPNLAAEPRVPVNQNIGYGQPTMIGMDQPTGNQAEVFMNQNVGLGTAPAMMPNQIAMMGGSPDINSLQPANVQITEQAPMIPDPVMAPAPMAAPQPMMMTSIPPQITGNGEPTVIATISKTKKLPASLMPAYNNPLNSESTFATAPMAMQQQPMMMSAPQIQSQQMQPMMPAAGNMPPMMMTKPIYTPTMPVDQMQMSPQPVQLN